MVILPTTGGTKCRPTTILRFLLNIENRYHPIPSFINSQHIFPKLTHSSRFIPGDKNSRIIPGFPRHPDCWPPCYSNSNRPIWLPLSCFSPKTDVTYTSYISLLWCTAYGVHCIPKIINKIFKLFIYLQRIISIWQSWSYGWARMSVHSDNLLLLTASKPLPRGREDECSHSGWVTHIICHWVLQRFSKQHPSQRA